MYYVVFEYTKEAGGFAGVRTYTSYPNEARFKTERRNPLSIVIAPGISEQECANLTALTPEVCRITAAIQEVASKKDGTIDKEHLSFTLRNAGYAISFDRERIYSHNLSRNPDYTKAEVDEKANTDVAALIKLALNSASPLGQVDLDYLILRLNLEMGLRHINRHI